MISRFKLVLLFLVTSLASGSVTRGQCVGDATNDGQVNSVDIAQVLADWGPCWGCLGDTDANGQVSASDLAQVLAAWGPCPPASDCTSANWVPGANLSGCDLSGVTMSGVSLLGANLRGANLAGSRLVNVTLAAADLTNVNLEDSELVTCNLGGASLTNASMSNIKFENCEAAGSSMVGADLQGAVISQGDFRGTDLRGADLSQALIAGTSLSGCCTGNGGLLRLTGTRLEGANLVGTQFRFVSLTDVDITGWDLSNVFFEGVLTCNGVGAPTGKPSSWGPYRLVPSSGSGPTFNVLLGPGVFFFSTYFEGQDLSGIDLSGSTCFSAGFSQCDLADANFEMASFNCQTCAIATPNTGVQIFNCNIDGARFAGAWQYRLYATGLTGTPASIPDDWELVDGCVVARGATIGAADFSERDFSGRDFRDTQFVSTNFTGANLSGANFSSEYYASINANFTNADLSNADFSQTAFGPWASGVPLRMTGAIIEGTRFTNADIRRVASGQLKGVPVGLPSTHRIVNGYLIGPRAVLYQAALSGADLRGVDLRNAQLGHADLSYADLTGGVLQNIYDWYQTDLSFANLTLANLAGSFSFQYANTTGTIWQSTVCPNGGPPQDCSCQQYPSGNCP